MLVSRFVNISSFVPETDDQLAIAQLLKYDEINLYQNMFLIIWNIAHISNGLFNSKF